MKIVNLFGVGGKEVSEAFYGSQTEVRAKYFRDNGAMTARLIVDGRVIERDVDTRGVDIFAVFGSQDEFRAYEAKAPEVVRREWW
jgi:hypothetical protein